MTNASAPADPAEAAFRDLGNATLAGLATGVLVGGVGGRIAMRVSAIAAGSDGRFTIGGTLGLVIILGAVSGLVGGVVLFAAVLPLMGLTTVVTSESRNFRDSPELNVAMFAALFVALGAVVVLAEASSSRVLPKSPFGDGAGGPIYRGAALLAMLAAILTTLLLFVDGVCVCRAPRLVGVFFVLMSIATVLRAVDEAGGARLARIRGATAPLGYTSLIGACVAGAYYAMREIDAIL